MLTQCMAEPDDRSIVDKLAVGAGVDVYFIESHTFWTVIHDLSSDP